MVKIDRIVHKIRRKLTKLRLQPIRVFCLHHVCEQFDAESMYPCDWMALDAFKQKINNLRNQGYQFISLTEAYNHLKKDHFRRKKYAVLNFDDGYQSIKEVLPWLEEQQIPATLFINGKYLDGVSYRETNKEKYLTYDELFALDSPLIDIGHHGWEHKAANQMKQEEFEESISMNINLLSSHPRYIPFWAYTYGNYTARTDEILATYSLIPVKLTGDINIKSISSIQRESIFYIDEHIRNKGMCRSKEICKKCIYNF